MVLAAVALIAAGCGSGGDGTTSTRMSRAEIHAEFGTHAQLHPKVSSRMVVVPDVVGKPQAQGARKLHKRGLAVWPAFRAGSAIRTSGRNAATPTPTRARRAASGFHRLYGVPDPGPLPEIPPRRPADRRQMNGSDRSASAAENRRIANLLGALALEAVGQIDAAAGEVTGLSRSGVAALVALVNFASELPQSELQTALGLSQPATTRVVDRLVDEGLVARTRNIDGDGRELRLAPTRAGRVLAKRVGAARMGAMTDLVVSLPAERRAGLGACMEPLSAS